MRRPLCGLCLSKESKIDVLFKTDWSTDFDFQVFLVLDLKSIKFREEPGTLVPNTNIENRN
jgi:hypothetical protein